MKKLLTYVPHFPMKQVARSSLKLRRSRGWERDLRKRERFRNAGENIELRSGSSASIRITEGCKGLEGIRISLCEMIFGSV